MALLKKRAGAVSVGLDVSSRQIRLVAIGLSGGEGPCLRQARVLELGGPPDEHAVRRAWKAAGSPVGAHCGLGPSEVIVQQVEFPEMAPEELQAAARIEAEQLMPDIGEMVVDFQEIGRHAAPDRDGVGVRMLIVAAPKPVVDERLRLLNRAGVKVLSLVPDGLALANAVARLQGTQRGAVIVLDIAEADTNLVVLGTDDNGSAPVVRRIRAGARALPVAHAARPYEGASLPAADAEGERWLREVERSLAFAGEKLGSRPDRVLVVGESAASSHMLSWIETSLQMPVEPWNPLRDLPVAAGAPGRDFVERHGTQCAVAAGLAFMQET